MKTAVSAIVLFASFLTSVAVYGMTPAEIAGYAESQGHLYWCKASDCRTAIEYYSIAIRLDPKRADAFSFRGKAYLGRLALFGTTLKGFDRYEGTPDLDKSIADYTEAIRLYTDADKKAWAYCDRGKVFEFRKNWDQAIADYSDAIRLSPEHISAFMGRGDVFMERREWDKAIADYSKALEINPDFGSEIYPLRRKAYLKKGDWDKAIADYTEEIRLREDDSGTDKSDLYWGRGHAHLKKGDDKKAAADFHQAFFDPATYCEGYSGPLFYEDILLFGHLFLRNDEQSDQFDGQIANYTALLKYEKNFSPAYWDRAVAYMGKGEAKKAIADFTEVLRLDPKADEVYLHRAVAYLKEKNGKKALADSIAYVRLNSKHYLGYRVRGDAHAMTGDWNKAISDYTQYIHIAKNIGLFSVPLSDRTIYWDRGNAYLEKGDRQRAAADFKSALGLDGDREETVHYDDGWSRGELEAIVAKYTELIRLDPKCARAYCGRGRTYEALGETKKAIADYTEAIRLDPQARPRPRNAPRPGNNPFSSGSPEGPAKDRKPNFNEALRCRGRIFLGMNEWDKAIADYTAWIRLDPKADDAFEGRAFAYLKKGVFDKAVADYGKVVEIDPNRDFTYLLGIGKAYASKGDHDKAIAAFSKAIQANYCSEELLCGRGNLYANKGEYGKAIADYSKAVKRYTLTAWPAYVALGEARVKTGKPDEAINDYTIALAIRPEAPLIWCGRGDVYEKKGNLEKAVADYSEAIRLDPQCVTAYRSRAKALKSQGRLEEAQKDIQQAEKLGAKP